jgi:hypothetical protein
MNHKRMVVVADFHSGHEYGLTPPDWHRSGTGRTAKTGRFERSLWKFYTQAIDNLGPVDILVVNGDCIEGKGESSGGVELITPDRHDQAQMAADAINHAGAKHVRIVYGTRRHVGKDEDFEDVLVDKVKAKDVKIQGHAFFRVNGCGVDFKHKVASSNIPHGRHTAIAREHLWNVMWAEHQRQPRADILIRSHVHYFDYCGGTNWLGVTTPALTYNSHYGVRECSGLVDVGFLVFDFDSGGGFTWHPILADFAELKVRPESL